MNEYIKNINLFLSQTKIKSSYISLKSGIDEEKMSHILSGIQDVNTDGIIKIAKAPGKDVGFFSNDKSQENINYDFQETVYPEETNKKQKTAYKQSITTIGKRRFDYEFKRRFYKYFKIIKKSVISKNKEV